MKSLMSLSCCDLLSVLLMFLSSFALNFSSHVDVCPVGLNVVVGAFALSDVEAEFASLTLSESDVEISVDDFPVSVLVVGSCVVDLVVVAPDVGIHAVPFLPDKVLEDNEEADVDNVLLDICLEPS